MFDEEFAGIPQQENLETLTSRVSGLKRPRQRIHELSDQQNLTPNGSVIELESDTDTNNQRKTVKNSKNLKFQQKLI